MRTIGEARREKYDRPGKSLTDHSKEYYQTREWRELRERSRKEKRKEHERIALEVYMQHPGKNDPEALLEFVLDPKRYPLSEQSLKQGIIARAPVCDHIRPRREGGSDTLDNLQWLTLEQHSTKTNREG